MICKFDKTIFENHENGYRIVSYKTIDESVPQNARNRFYSDKIIRFTAVGYNLPVTNTVNVDLSGKWSSGKYGMQYEVNNFTEIMPKTKNGVIGYLSGSVKGIGPQTAKLIVNKFGMDTLDIIENDPNKLLCIKGINEQKLKSIIASYSESKDLKDIMTILSPFGISMAKAAKIQNAFGTNTLAVLQNCPFRLCEISGFGFKTVDAIAQKIGCKPNDTLRIRGAIMYALDMAAVEGHLFLKYDDLNEKVYVLLNAGFESEVVGHSDISEETDKMVGGGRIVYSDGNLYKLSNYYAETDTAARIVEFLKCKSDKINVSSELIQAQSVLNLTLSPKQAEAVKMCFENNISIITGGPGTGKTTILCVILSIYEKICKNGINVLLAAPTGRASRRMTESTGYEASTIHSALGLITDDDEGDYMNSDDPLEYDFIIVDELSMIDMRLASELFNRIRDGTRILLVGDADQLPSVGAGSVFRELINCGQIPTTFLDVVFRQSQTSRIVLNAQAIKENKSNLLYGDDFQFIECETEEKAVEIIRNVYRREIAAAGVNNVQILAPFKKRGDTCVKNLNEIIHDLVNPKSPALPELKAGLRVFREKDKVMQIKNKHGITNGDMGTVVTIYKGQDDDDSYAKVQFSDERIVEYGAEDLSMVEHAYAVTIHKSQGSEFDTVIIPLFKSFYIMLKRNLIYTAITRARKKIIIIGQKAAVAIAVYTNDIEKRNTALAERIKRNLLK